MIGVLVSAQNTVCAAIYKFSSWLLLVFPMQLNPRFIERSAACNDVVWLTFSQKRSLIGPMVSSSQNSYVKRVCLVSSATLRELLL
jgi:hypothetical protein